MQQAVLLLWHGAREHELHVHLSLGLVACLALAGYLLRVAWQRCFAARLLCLYCNTWQWVARSVLDDSSCCGWTCPACLSFSTFEDTQAVMAELGAGSAIDGAAMRRDKPLRRASLVPASPQPRGLAASHAGGAGSAAPSALCEECALEQELWMAERIAWAHSHDADAPDFDRQAAQFQSQLDARRNLCARCERHVSHALWRLQAALRSTYATALGPFAASRMLPVRSARGSALWCCVEALSACAMLLMLAAGSRPVHAALANALQAGLGVRLPTAEALTSAPLGVASPCAAALALILRERMPRVFGAQSRSAMGWLHASLCAAAAVTALAGVFAGGRAAMIRTWALPPWESLAAAAALADLVLTAALALRCARMPLLAPSTSQQHTPRRAAAPTANPAGVFGLGAADLDASDDGDDSRAALGSPVWAVRGPATAGAGGGAVGLSESIESTPSSNSSPVGPARPVASGVRAPPLVSPAQWLALLFVAACFAPSLVALDATAADWLLRALALLGAGEALGLVRMRLVGPGLGAAAAAALLWRACTADSVALRRLLSVSVVRSVAGIAPVQAVAATAGVLSFEALCRWVAREASR